MPRLPEVLDRNSLPEADREVFDYLAQTRGSVRLPFSVLLNNAEVTRRVAHVGTYARFETSLPREVSEAAICTAAREMDCRFEWAAHSRMAVESGVRQEVVDVIAHRRDVSGLSADESLPIRFARAVLLQHRVDDALYQEAQSRFGDKGVLDLTATIGYYACLACLINTMEILPAADAPQLP